MNIFFEGRRTTKKGGATNKLKYEQIQMLARCGPYHGGVWHCTARGHV
jgi:hypothetical protein